MDRDVCIQNMFDIITDRIQFKELPTDPTIARENQLQRSLRFMKWEQIFVK